MAHSPSEQRDDVRVSHALPLTRRKCIPGCPDPRRLPADSLEIGGGFGGSRAEKVRSRVLPYAVGVGEVAPKVTEGVAPRTEAGGSGDPLRRFAPPPPCCA